MKKKTIIAMLVIAGLSLISCNRKDIKPLNGILDSVFQLKAPEKTQKIAEKFGFDENYEKLLDEKEDGVGVYSIYGFKDGTSSEGFGILVHKDGVWSAFPEICHGKNPLARYDKKRNSLWLTGGVMEGTGVFVEKPYLIKFEKDGKARIAGDIDPYLMQKALGERFGYSIKDENITFYAGERELCTRENKVKDMGGFDEDAIWIGEQLFYDISGDDLYVYFVPGVKFVTGLVLHYENMPTLMARVTIDKDGNFTLSDENSVLWPFEGSFVDEDYREPNLEISYRRNDGKYNVLIGIPRLTLLDDGLAVIGDNGLEFTATDAAGNPIGGEIILKGDTAVVTFTSSTWPLLEQGTSFRYIRSGN
ncbi:MAG: hypothetical protein IKQ20_00775 [Bacteroidales bacterium]|nr:hypothetical protein [Bacteroidales bacterium]